MQDARVSFCVVEHGDIRPAEFTTYFENVIVFGKTRILTDEEEKRMASGLLSYKYSPDESGKEAETTKGVNQRNGQF